MSDIAYMYIPRISIPGFPVRGKKKYLNPQELEKLLDGEIRIEEKLDGKLTRIYSDPLPVISFAWFGEDLHYKHIHNIPYCKDYYSTLYDSIIKQVFDRFRIIMNKSIRR